MGKLREVSNEPSTMPDAASQYEFLDNHSHVTIQCNLEDPRENFFHREGKELTQMTVKEYIVDETMKKPRRPPNTSVSEANTPRSPIHRKKRAVGTREREDEVSTTAETPMEVEDVSSNTEGVRETDTKDDVLREININALNISTREGFENSELTLIDNKEEIQDKMEKPLEENWETKLKLKAPVGIYSAKKSRHEALMKEIFQAPKKKQMQLKNSIEKKKIKLPGQKQHNKMKENLSKGASDTMAEIIQRRRTGDFKKIINWSVKEMAKKPRIKYAEERSVTQYREWSPSQDWPITADWSRQYENPVQNPHRNNQYYNQGLKFSMKTGRIGEEAQ